MSKKPRLGRNMNALLGGATRNRREQTEKAPEPADSETSPTLEPSASQPADSLAASADAAAAVQTSAVNVSSSVDSAGTSLPVDASPTPNTSDVSAEVPHRVNSSMSSSRAPTSTEPDNSSNRESSISSGLSTTQSKTNTDSGGSGSASESSASSLNVSRPAESASTPPAPHLRSVSVSETPASATSLDTGGDVLKQIGIDLIRRGAWQPRRHFDQELLQELADSLKAQGMIQPVLVRPFANGAHELIAGERRWRAAQLAGLHEIPALVRDMEDKQVAAVSLIENIQRKDLNPLEEAQAFERLCDEFGMTHKAVAESVGRSRASVTNLMRLLELHDEVKVLVDKGLLEMGHARALLAAPLEQQPELATRIIDQGLTVRAIEKLIRDQQAGKPARGSASTDRVSDPDIDRLSRKLGELLGTSVEIRHKTTGAGRLEISYTSVTELEGILDHIK